MPALPTTQDVRWVRKQAEAGITGTFDAVRSPLFAVLGAVDAARSEATGRAQPTELRRLAETCGEAMQKAYSSLVERGEEIFDELRSQPRVKQALDSVESSVDTAQERLELVISDLNSAAADLRSRLARTSRSGGEKVARETQGATTAAAQQVRQTADEVSAAVPEAGEEAAAGTRSATRRAANRAAPPRKPATRRPGENNTRGSSTH